jgi:beta-glucanase (GH16 family)
VWSDEFSNTTGANAQPNPAVWFYSTGPADECCDAGFSVECAWDSSVSPCSAAYPNSFVDGYLHIVVQQPTPGVYTSAAIRTEGLFSFKYGRIEARLKLPESQAMWPAFWLMGNNVATIEWPACGESDVMEHWDGSDPLNLGYDWTQGTIHGTGFSNWGRYHAPGFIAADWHTYGMIWTPGEIEYYVDDPANIYATFTPSTQNGPWPFDAGPQFVILQVGIGGPGGAPDATTVLPSEMLVDYVRIYTN